MSKRLMLRSYCGVIARSLIVAILGLVAAAGPRRVTAQSPVAHGSVLDSARSPLSSAIVVLETLNGRHRVSTRSDARGQFRVRLAASDVAPTDSVAVSVSALGYQGARYPLLASQLSSVSPITFRLRRLPPQTLATVRVNERRRVPLRTRVIDTDSSGVSSTVNISVAAPQMRGDIGQLMGLAPGVTVPVGGPTDRFAPNILGAAAGESQLSLNGVAWLGGQFPRTAQLAARVTTTAFDPSIGGFSGGLIAATIAPGSLLSTGSVAVFGETAAAGRGEAGGAAFAQDVRSTNLALSRTGAVLHDAMVFNFAGQVSTRRVPTRSLADGLTLERADTLPALAAGRVQAALRSGGLTVPNAALSSAQRTASALLRVDARPRANRELFGFVMGSTARAEGTGGWTPETFDHRVHDVSGDVTAGVETSRLLSSSTLVRVRGGVSAYRRDRAASSSAPEGTVNSRMTNADVAGSDVAFGAVNAGVGALGRSSASVTSELVQRLGQDRHEVKLMMDLRYDRTRRGPASAFGQLYYSSLASLEQGRPTVYTFTPARTPVAAAILNSAASLGDVWRPTNALTVQAGVRIDASRRGALASEGDDIRGAFGRPNAKASTRSLSPRVGFTWSFGRQGGGVAAMNVRRRGQLRGGVGVFQSWQSLDELFPVAESAARAEAGPPIACFGDDVPAVNLGSSGPPATACRGEAASYQRALGARLLSDAYRPPRAVRASIGATTSLFQRVILTLDALNSRTQYVSSLIDRNVQLTRPLALERDGGRLVYAPLQSIDTATGRIDARAARVVAGFGRVTEDVSDASQHVSQVSASIAPLNLWSRFGLAWQLRYSTTSARSALRASDVGVLRSPVEMLRTATPGLSKHQVSFYLSSQVDPRIQLSLGLWFRSGTHFSPLIASDVNGDAAANDLALVSSLDQLRGWTPSRITGWTDALPSGVRRCARSALSGEGRLLACQTRWSSVSTLSLGVRGDLVGLPSRSRLTARVSNLASLADAALGGNRRGWGLQSQPDTRLLRVAAFDARQQRYVYAINERFGRDLVSTASFQQPALVSIELSLPLVSSATTQVLRSVMPAARPADASRSNVATVKRGLARLAQLNPVQELLVVRDSLGLTRDQVRSLDSINSRYNRAADSAWTRLAAEIASSSPATLDPQWSARLRTVRLAVLDRLSAAVAAARDIVAPDQFAMLAPDTRYLFTPAGLQALRTEIESQ